MAIPQRMKFKWQVPPGGFSYVVPETGQKIQPDGRRYSRSFKGLLTAVIDHYLVNKLEVPDELTQIVMDDVCDRAGPGFCVGGTVATGLGDTVAQVTDALGIPKCLPCSRRQETLNKMVNYQARLVKKRQQEVLA